MPKLIDFFKDMAVKAGIPADDANLVKVLTDPALAAIEIDPTVSNIIDRNLLSLTAAKANPEVRKALETTFKAELYNGIDAEIDSAMTDLGLTDAQKTEILFEKGSGKRAALLAKKVKEYEAANHTAAGTSDKKELLTKVNDLNNNIAKLQREHADALKAKDTELSDKLLQKDVETDLLGFNYIFPKETPNPVKLAAAKNSIDRRLAEKGLKVVTTDAGRKIVRLDGTDYFDENNKAVSYNDFISGALAQDNLLLVSDGNNAEGGKAKLPEKVTGSDGKESKVNQSLLASADEDLANIASYITK